MGRKTIRGEVKIPYNFRLTPTTVAYLDKLALENNVSRAEALELIVDYIRDNSTQQQEVDNID